MSEEPARGAPAERAQERPTSVEDALEQFLERRQRGEVLDARVFAAEHAELGPELESALEVLVTLEHAGDSDEPPMPERIGAFRVLREVGRGGMGVVYEAVEEPLGRRVALKVLPPELLTSSSARARLRREAQLASRLDHSGIATVYGAGVEAEEPWIAMRFVEGRTLSSAIADAREGGRTCASPGPEVLDGPPAVRAMTRCIASVARALQYAHEQGVVHRDVKPSNIVVDALGAPVLLDFGLAIGEDVDGQTLTRTGHTAGTPAYFSPEMVSGERARPDAQSDVYSLGVTLYECLALRRPFEGPTPVALFRAIESAAATDVRSHNRDVSRDLAVVVTTAMERDPQRRYRSAAAFAADLEACAEGHPIVARRVPLGGRILRWARREPRQALLAGSLVLASLAAAVAVGSWWTSRAEVRAAAGLTAARNLETALQDGFGHLATNWLEEAELDFRHALDVEPDNVEAYAGLALVSMKRHRDDEAVERLDRGPATPAFRALRALAAGELPDVEQDAEWLARAGPVDLFVDGMRLRKQRERVPRDDRPALARLALARLEDALLRSPTTRMLYHIERAMAAMDARDDDAIRSAASALAVLWPGHERAHFTAGLVLRRIDPHAAIEHLRRAIELDAHWGAPWQNLGNALLDFGDEHAAIAAFERALELDPADADAYNSLGIAYGRIECPDESRTAYELALRRRPMFETWANLGLHDAARGDPALAEIELRKALEWAPRDASLRLGLLRALRERGEPRLLRAEAEAAAAWVPRDVQVWREFARCLADNGETDAALAAVRAGLDVAPGDEALVELGELLESGGDPSR